MLQFCSIFVETKTETKQRLNRVQNFRSNECYFVRSVSGETKLLKLFTLNIYYKKHPILHLWV